MPQASKYWLFYCLLILFGTTSLKVRAESCAEYKYRVEGRKICVIEEKVCEPSVNYYLTKGVQMLWPHRTQFGKQIDKNAWVYFERAIKKDKRAKPIVARLYLITANSILNRYKLWVSRGHKLKDVTDIVGSLKKRAKSIEPDIEVNDWVELALFRFLEDWETDPFISAEDCN